MKCAVSDPGNRLPRKALPPCPKMLYNILVLALAQLLVLQAVSHVRASVVRLTSDGRSYSRVGLGWSPDGSRILFSKEFEDGVQLWLMDADGSNARAISKVGWQENYGWAPDSKKIVYAYAEKRDNNMQGSLFVYDIDSGQRRQLASGFRWIQFEDYTGWAMLEWTKDSKEFVLLMKRFADDSPRADSYLFDAQTGRSIALTPNNYTTGRMYAGSWSPDNRRFALVSKSSPSANYRIWVCEHDGSGLHPITPLDWDIKSDPRWSPTGDKIAFCTTYRRLEDEKKWNLCDLWITSPDGKDLKPVTQGTSPSSEKRWGFSNPEWTADGRYVLCIGMRFDQTGYPYNGLYLVEVSTGNIITILENDPDSDQVLSDFRHKLSISPDGRRIAFVLIQRTVRGRKTENPIYQDQRDILYYYDIPSRTLQEVQRARPKEDGYALWHYGFNWRPFFGPTGDSLLFTRAKIISLTDWMLDPDLYVYRPDVAPTEVTPGAEPTPTPTKVEEKPEEWAVGTTVLVTTRNRRAADIAEALPEEYGPMYRVDRGLNALVVSAQDESTLAAFKRDVALLDRPTPQILVDVMVTELTDDASRQLGLDWKGACGRFGLSLPLVNGLDAGHVFYQGVGKLTKEFFVTLSALEEQGKARVHANPRVLASCGSEATINIRRTDNFLYESGVDYQGKPVRSRSDISADTILKIVPQLLASNRIAMKVDATVDSFIFGAKNDLPDTTRRQAITDVVCGDGETLIIGGLTLQEETTKIKKTPVLGDLPLVGGLFRNVSRSSKQSNLVILVSPHVVSAGAS